jgi:hypothetical protein
MCVELAARVQLLSEERLLDLLFASMSRIDERLTSASLYRSWATASWIASSLRCVWIC